jgi:O-antigen ligase
MSGWLPGLIGVGIILFLRFPVPILLATPLVAVLGFIGQSLFTEMATAGDNVYSLETRLAALQTLLPIMKANPLLGVGPANYYYYTVLYPIMGWYVRFSSHNNYLDFIAQTGLLGLACFLWLGFAIGKTAWSMLGRSLTGFESGYVYAAIGGLVATYAAAGLGDWVIPFVYNAGFAGFRTSILPWLFLGGLVALEQRVNRRA